MTSRVTRDEMLMEVAHAIAKRGTCSRLQVGAVFSRDGRIVSTGYNGAPAGMPHCVHETFTIPTIDDLMFGERQAYPQWVEGFLSHRESPVPSGTVLSYDGRTVSWKANGKASDSGCTQAEHAERNAIAWAARHGLALEGTEVHVTHMPCLACARTLVNAGVTKLTYDRPYRLREGIILLAEAGVEVWESDTQIDPRF